MKLGAGKTLTAYSKDIIRVALKWEKFRLIENGQIEGNAKEALDAYTDILLKTSKKWNIDTEEITKFF